MDQPSLRLLILEKLADGRLPRTPVPRVWSGSGNGEACDGCGELVTKAQMVMEGLDAKGRRVQFHVACSHLWDVERQVPRHEPSARSSCPIRVSEPSTPARRSGHGRHARRHPVRQDPPPPELGIRWWWAEQGSNLRPRPCLGPPPA